MTTNDRRWLRTSEALEVVPVGRTTLNRWIREGRVEARRIDGIRLIDRHSLDALLSKEDG